MDIRKYFNYSIFCFIFCLTTTLAEARGPLDLATAVVPPGAQHIIYGSDPLQVGELRLPATQGPHPVAIVIHGGCWAAKLGNWDPRSIAMDNMRPLAAALTKQGIATWNVEYRRLDNPGGGWPGTFQDIADATDVLRTLSKQYSLDLTRVVVIGHSAGGHLAFWSAARPNLAKTSELYTSKPLLLKGAINLDGPANLKAVFVHQQAICNRPVMTELMGGSPEAQSQRYQDASPIELLPLRVAQMYFVSQKLVDHATQYAEAAEKSGDKIKVFIFPTASHFDFIDPEAETWPSILAGVQQLLSNNQAESKQLILQ